MSDSESLRQTRSYIQDIAKVTGKFQQLFLPEHPDQWQKGMLVVANGLQSPSFELEDEETRIQIDMLSGNVSVLERSWQLGTISAQQLLADLQKLTDKTIAKPELVPDKHTFDADAAKNIVTLLEPVSKKLVDFGTTLKTGIVSPVLLYPHHFDLSLVWFLFRPDISSRDERQVGFGFSLGDETIQEPYLYVTAYPEPATFPSVPLDAPAYWQKTDFSGAVMKYADVVKAENSDEIIETFLKTGLQAF